MKTPLIGVFVALLLSAGYVLAGEFGSADEAKAMLENAVVALKADKDNALRHISSGEAGFRDRDLYPFCVGPDGNFSAYPAQVGQRLKDMTDKSGKALGNQM
jgi:hypothetical protein